MRTVRRRAMTGLAILGATALIAGCSGGDESADPGPTPTEMTETTEAPSTLSEDELLEEAAAICTEVDEDLDALDEPATPSADDVLPFLEEGLALQEEAIEDLRALEPPEELADDFQDAIDLLDEQSETIADFRDEVEGGADVEQIAPDFGEEIEALESEADEAFEDIGLDECVFGADEDGDTQTDTETDTDTEPPPPADDGGDGSALESYRSDVLAAGAALQEFGTSLSSIGSLDDLSSMVGALEANLDDFDAAIASLGDYTLDDPTLEEQRQGLLETGPRVSETLRQFIRAAAEGDVTRVQELLPEVQSAVTDFQRAATGG